MTGNPYSDMVGVACIVAFVLAIGPFLIYLFTGWGVRREKLLSYMTDGALEVYYKQFPWTAFEKEPDLTKRFRKQFTFLYGRRHYIAPTVLLILSAGLGAVFIGMLTDTWISAGDKAPFGTQVAASALLGAFLWSIFDELNRIRRRDISPGDVYGWSLRLLICVPFGFAIAALWKSEGVPLAFFLGAFPTQTLFTIARRIASQKLGLGDQSTAGALELEQLQSVSRTNAEQFGDEGISTIGALAWADPIDLTVRTNFDLNYVLDCMSQALLWVYLAKDADKAKSLYALSFRGAQEVSRLVTDLAGLTIPPAAGATLSREQSTALATLNEAAQVLGISAAALVTTLSQVNEDPYTQFILEVWH